MLFFLTYFTLYSRLQHNLILKLFPLPQNKTHIHLDTPHSYPQPKATTNLLSVSINLTFLDISYKCIIKDVAFVPVSFT